jgi:hypothetical protein
MGKVIPLKKNKNVDEGLVAYLEAMLASARRGQARGGAGMFEMEDGSVQVFFRGTFASDEERAVQIASEAIELFCHKRQIPHPTASTMSALPRALRKVQRGPVVPG